MQRSLSKWAWVSGLAIGAMSLPTYATIAVDGTLNESDYGPSAPGTSALATQTINDSFGDNLNNTGNTTASELDAAYGVVKNNTLYVFLAGNLNNTGNILQVWFDDGRTGGQNTLSAATTAGSMHNTNGAMFSPGFNATYALEINESKSTTNANNGTIFVDQYNLLAGTASFIGSFAATGGIGNSAETGSNESTIQVGFNDTNIGGVVGDTAGGAANQANAQTVNTGIELGIPLSILGNPTTGIKVLAAINGSGDSGEANQFLPGLEAGTPSVKKGPLSATNPYFLQGNGTATTGEAFTFANTPNEYFTVPNSNLANGIWLPTGGGSWGTAGNWSNGAIPNAAGATASFSSSASSGSDIELDGNRTVGSISFNTSAANSYTFDASNPSANTLIMDNGTSNASISDLGGTHLIFSNIQLNSTTLVSVPNHGDQIFLAGNISGVGGLSTAAATNLNINQPTGIYLLGTNTYQGPTIVQGGVLQLDSPGALPIGTALTLDSPTPHGMLDLDGNSATVSSLTDTGNGAAIINSGGGPATFTYAGSNANPSTFDGSISDTTGTTSLVIAGGSLTLTGTNSYLGTTTIAAGATLAISPAMPTGTTIEGPGDITDNGNLLINDFVVTGNNVLGTGSTTVNTGMILLVNNFTQGSLANNGSVTISGTGNIGNVSGSGALVDNNSPLTITGNGTVGNITGGGTLSVGGHLQMVAGSGQSQQNALTITGTLDITNNALVISFGGNSDPMSTIAGYIKSGYDHGKWDGTGLISSTAASTPGTAIGYADGNTDSGTAAQGGQILIRYTWLGDLNLDGAVTPSDLATMMTDNGMINADWAQGDLNYDGKVNADDFALLALGAADSQGATLPVPEPASIALLTMPLLGLRRRRSI